MKCVKMRISPINIPLSEIAYATNLPNNPQKLILNYALHSTK
jgi:hypothetical protein